MTNNPAKHIDYKQTAQRILDLFGINFDESKFESLNYMLQNAAKEMHMPLEELNHRIVSRQLNINQLKQIATHITICETYFFREKTALDFFVNQIAERIKQSDKTKKIKIWSAGCSSGEEPYSLAILLRELLQTQIKEWEINIYASDLNTKVLDKAKEGKYTQWSFRETPKHILDKYFTKDGKCYRISPEIKSMVKFFPYNLKDLNPYFLDNAIPLDWIFCRNVLMYFSPNYIQNISHNYYQLLKYNGYFISSQVELIDEFYPDFKKVHFNNGIFYQKQKEKIEQNEVSHSKSNAKPLILQKESNRTSKTIVRNTTTAQEANLRKARLSISEQKAELKLQLQTYFKKAMYETYIHHYSKANPEILELTDKINYIKSLANVGSMDIAFEELINLIDQDPENDQLLILLAILHMDRKRISEAEHILTKAIYLNPNSMCARFHLGNIYLQQNRQKVAKKQFSNLLNLLRHHEDEHIITELDGITVGRLRQIIQMHE